MKNATGIFCQKPVELTEDLPIEVMIEVEPRCNFNCQFCFNKISFAKNGRNIKEFSTAYVKKIIDGIAKAGIKIVRFTGGEPLLRKDIFELMKYAKKKGLGIYLNTNGSLVTMDVAKKLKGIVDNVLIPIEGYRRKDEKRLTEKGDSLTRKINAIKLLRKAKITVVRAGTVVIRENILNLEKLARFIFRLPIDSWELYRPISSQKSITAISGNDIKLLIHKLIKIKKRAKIPVFLANALPFCAVSDLNKANIVSRGAFFDDGHNRLAIDPRGFVKPNYFFNKNIGDPFNVLGAWNHPFMKRMRTLKYLPKDCLNCRFKLKCRGGSRHEAKITFGSYRAPDPLASFRGNKLI